MSILKEFREFAVKGNVVDMAVGVVIGAAFGKIVSSLVADLVTPALGVLIGGVSFSHLEVVLKEAAEKAPAVTVRYGVFLQALFDFLLIAAALFVVVRLINRLRRTPAPEPAPAAPPPPTKDQELLGEIRDAVRALKA
jgi:large conductance mechanosensitive channel